MVIRYIIQKLKGNTMKNFNEEILTIDEKKRIEELVNKFSKDDRDFIRVFWVEPLSIKDDVWKIAFLNSQENYYAVITTDKTKEPLQEIINFLEEFIETKHAKSININNFVLSIKKTLSKVLFSIYYNDEIIYQTNINLYILVAYLYGNLMLFIREKYDFDIPYFDKDILSIYSNILGKFNLVTDMSDENAYDFYGPDDAGYRWQEEKDDIRKAKWCLISANAKRILINNRFCYEYKGKLIKESDMSKLIYDMDILLEMEKDIFGEFLYKSIDFDDTDPHTCGKKMWYGIFKCEVDICGVKSIAHLGGFSSYFDTEAEVHSCLIAQYLFCKLGLDSTIYS